jgi:hypothetical protein
MAPSVSFIGIVSLVICLFAQKCKLSSQLGMLLDAKWFHREIQCFACEASERE